MEKGANNSTDGRLIVLSLGRDIVAAAERMFGQKSDAVIRKPEVSPQEYPAIRQEIYQYLKMWQEEPIRMVLSGPVALNFTLGQMVGINHFDLEVFQFSAEERRYNSITSPTRAELI